HWRLLGVRRHPGISPALLAWEAPSGWGFRGIGAWGAVRRSCYSLSSAPALRLAVLKVISRAVIDSRSTAATLTRVTRSSTLAAGFSPTFSEAAGAQQRATTAGGAVDVDKVALSEIRRARHAQVSGQLSAEPAGGHAHLPAEHLGQMAPV